MVERIARDARAAGRVVGKAGPQLREQAIRRVAARVRESAPRILEANRADVAAAQAGLAAAMIGEPERSDGSSSRPSFAGAGRPPLIDRLKLDDKRLGAMARALDDVASLADPVGSIEGMSRRPNGLLVGKMRIPLGVILMIYEARPNVTTDAFALCLRAGNAVILRGGSEAAETNRALGAEIAAGLEEAGLPAAAAQVVPVTDRSVIEELLRREDEIDLVIPRGGEGLIRYVAERSRIPVIKHYKGVCHVYVDSAADATMAVDICENAKVSRPGVCNACETILVHEKRAAEMVPRLVERLRGRGVEIRGDEAVRRLGGAGIVAATEDDWRAEYLDLIVAMRVVPSFEAAVAHIETYGSQHTEAIVTGDWAAARRFVDQVDSSTVLVNASTRFADGGELGLGAEIGISTSKLHAFGPMGHNELTTTKFVVFGDGQIR